MQKWHLGVWHTGIVEKQSYIADKIAKGQLK